ncbi:hypothetical protein L915_09996 [Phytophthora nicotianae]|uniref:Uncharacterized protein n=1 Tax=Phytophthora nicotianae TaxID=4792 RepID=W2GQ27_PHYNI|nr:hypothetical protein L915_09996 [Phytophthora nicotianae]
MKREQGLTLTGWFRTYLTMRSELPSYQGQSRYLLSTNLRR